MSVTLNISWPDKETEFVPVCGQRTAVYYASKAAAMGLKYLPYLAGGYLPVTQENIDEFIDEIERFQLIIPQNPHSTELAFAQSLEALRRLRTQHGWSANFG